jgi:PqqD family protein of HPr-rel-A system
MRVVTKKAPAEEDWFESGVAHVPAHVVYRLFEAETLLLNLETGHYHGLNSTGGRIIELLEETGGSVQEVAARLASEYDMPVEELADDLSSFCTDLAERGLIEKG